MHYPAHLCAHPRNALPFYALPCTPLMHPSPQGCLCSIFVLSISHPVHRVIWQRFPNKLSASDFAKRLLILTFHFILKVRGGGGR